MLVRARLSQKRVVVAFFAALFAVLFIVVGVANGIGNPSVPSGDVAVVQGSPGGTVTMADFQTALKQSAARQGITTVPSPSNPQYPTLRDSAMSDVLLGRWVRGEAADRGISVSQTEVSSNIQQLKKQQFGGSQAKFQAAMKQAQFTLSDVRNSVELQLLSNEIQKQVLGPTAPTASQDEVKNYYEANKAQFSQPETRDVREIVNTDSAKVTQAQTLLSSDDSAQNWKKVAAKFSTDKTTQQNGGLHKGVAKGQGDPALDQQIFSAPQGQLVGPFKGQVGYYLIEVESITPATTTPLSKVSSQIQTTLGQGLQQEIATNFQQDFTDKWTSRTFCAKGYVMDRCSNFTLHDSCNGDDPGETGDLAKTGCPAFVPSTAPVAAGKASVFPGQTAQGLPQGPVGKPTPSTGAPGVLGPSGAPTLPPGAAPQGAAPPGG